MSDQRIQYSEEMVGAGHPTKSDTLNRLALVETDSDGHGKYRFLKAQASAPATAADEGAVYAKTVSGQVEAFYRGQSDGGEVQLTSGGKINAISAPIPLQDLWMDPDNPGTNVVLGSTANRKVTAIQLADGANQGFLGFVTLPDASRDYQLVIECAQSTSVSSKAIVLKVEMQANQAGEDPGQNSADVSSQQTITTRNDALMLIVENTNFKITSGYLHTDNIQARVGILRIGADAADTHTGATNIYRVYFKAV
jgi:hypothetical protein